MLVFRSVTLSLASMANVSIVVGLFFLIFAIMGVQLFGGLFWTCNDTSVANKVGQEGSQLKGWDKFCPHLRHADNRWSQDLQQQQSLEHLST